MPDTYVFPGGAVAAEDSRVCPASPLNPAAIRQMGVGDHAGRARALAVAAVRETAEETGLLLGEPGEPGPATAPVWQLFRQLGLAPALGHLQYIARAITPAFKPRRFHARFFLADAAYLSGDLAGNGELLDLHWVPFSGVERLLTTPATVFVLNEVRRWFEAGPEERRRKAVFTYHRRYGPRVRYEE